MYFESDKQDPNDWIDKLEDFHNEIENIDAIPKISGISW